MTPGLISEQTPTASSVETLGEHSDDRQPVDCPSHPVLGIRIHALTMAQALSWLERFIAAGVSRQVCLANAYTVSLCWYRKALGELVNRMDLVLPDGMSIVWAARWLGLNFPERVGGPDLTEALCALAAEKQYRIFLCGSTTDNLAQLRAVLLKRYPRLQIVGAHSPPHCDQLEENETRIILQELARTRPHVLLVGLSAPKQEMWIAQNLHRLDVPVCMGVGAAFDFLSGRIPRAPQWFRRSGFEWLYRLWREPRRLWKRYLLGNLIFLSALLKQAAHQRWVQRRKRPR